MTEEEPAKIPGADPSSGSAGWGVTGGQGEGDSDQPRALRMTLKRGSRGGGPGGLQGVPREAGLEWGGDICSAIPPASWLLGGIA